MAKIIQEELGQVLIDAVARFAGDGIDKPDALERTSLSHLKDLALRRRLAEVWYGARWIYKLGLALLVKGDEQAAHVRVQIVDFAAVCEGMLLDMIDHALTKNLMTGKRYRYEDAAKLRKPLRWTIGSHKYQLEHRSFKWFILIAEEEKIISAGCAKQLERLRGHRNDVHVRGGSHAAYISKSKEAFDAVLSTMTDTKKWKAAHP